MLAVYLPHSSHIDFTALALVGDGTQYEDTLCVIMSILLFVSRESLSMGKVRCRQ